MFFNFKTAKIFYKIKKSKAYISKLNSLFKLPHKPLIKYNTNTLHKYGYKFSKSVLKPLTIKHKAYTNSNNSKLKEKWLLFLHGWGGNNESFSPLYQHYLNDGFNIITLDFPPFGKSSSPLQPWSIQDYTNMVFNLLNQLRIRKIQIISHSFGGRVAILLGSSYNIVESLILIDSAGIKPKRNLFFKFKILKYKILKKLGFKQKNIGSIDYQQLSPIMKSTFINIVNSHLDNDCKLISCPTLIIFGEKDKDTPLYMAKKLNKLIKNSSLIIFKGSGHFSYLDNFTEFLLISKSFIKNGGK